MLKISIGFLVLFSVVYISMKYMNVENFETTTVANIHTTTTANTGGTAGGTTTTTANTGGSTGGTTTTTANTGGTTTTTANARGTTTTTANAGGTTTTIPLARTNNTIPMTTYGYRINNGSNGSNGSDSSNPQTNVYQKNFDGTSNVYAPYIYHGMEQFTPLNIYNDKYAEY